MALNQVADPDRDLRVPAYLGRVLDEVDQPIGTCFQVSPGILATAWHVLDSLGAGEVGCIVKVDALGGSGGPWEAVVRAVDELADLAVLETPDQLDASVAGFRSTDGEQLGCELVVTGVSEVEDPGHEYRFLDALGTW